MLHFQGYKFKKIVNAAILYICNAVLYTMKRLFTFLKITSVLFIAFSNANAQSLSFKLIADSVGFGTQGSTITVFGKLSNTTNSTINFKVTRITNDWPLAWGTPDNMFCFDGNCFSPTTNSVTRTLAGDTSTLFDTEWITGNSNDTAHIQMEFFNTSDSTHRIYQGFYAIVNGAAGIASVQVSSNPVSIFPNPFTTCAKLSIPSSLIDNNTSLIFNLYNETGIIVKSMTIATGGDFSLDRNNLPSGIYFYSISNNNSSNLIQRGKLLIF